MPTTTPWYATTEETAYPPLTENTDADVCVIGGGITGMTTAYLLQEQGRDVVLIECRKLASGVSGHTSGHLTSLVDAYYHSIISKYSEKDAKLLAEATTEARNLVERMISENSLMAGYEKVPGYYFMSDENQRKDFNNEKEALKKVGLEVEKADLDELPLKAIEAFKVPNQATLNAVGYVQGLARAFEEKGGRIYEQSLVRDFEKDGERLRMSTDDGSVLARKVVQATHTPIKINPVQMELMKFNSYVLTGESERDVKKGLFYDFAEPYNYIRNYEEGGKQMFIVGGFDQKTGTTDDERKSLENLGQYAWNELAIAKTNYKWSSMLFASPDDLPFIGEDPVHNDSYIATGFAGDGLTFGLISSILITSLITDGHHPWKKLFNPKRFSVTSVPDMLKENIHVAKHLVMDRFELDGTELEEISPGMGKILRLKGGEKLGIYVDETGGTYAIKPVCPHMKCIVHWNSVANTWDCGCHGSRFDKTGNLISGPSTENLQRVEIPLAKTGKKRAKKNNE